MAIQNVNVIANPVLTISSFTADVLEGGVSTDNAIAVTQPFTVNVSWQTSGFVSENFDIQWRVEVYFEPLGGAPDSELTELLVPIVPHGASPLNYNVNLPVAANTIVLPAGEDSLTARLIIALTARQPGVNSPINTAGYIEMVPIQFYQFP